MKKLLLLVIAQHTQTSTLYKPAYVYGKSLFGLASRNRIAANSVIMYTVTYEKIHHSK